MQYPMPMTNTLSSVWIELENILRAATVPARKVTIIRGIEPSPYTLEDYRSLPRTIGPSK